MLTTRGRLSRLGESFDLKDFNEGLVCAAKTLPASSRESKNA
jgi:hypothetical protein